MMATLGTVAPLHIMYATKIHVENDFHAELCAEICKCVYPKPLGDTNITTYVL
jgi:hypothetical protein